MRVASRDSTSNSYGVDVNSVGYGMEQLMLLMSLNMSFNSCTELVDVSSLGHAVGKLQNSNTLEAEGCAQPHIIFYIILYDYIYGM